MCGRTTCLNSTMRCGAYSIPHWIGTSFGSENSWSMISTRWSKRKARYCSEVKSCSNRSAYWKMERFRWNGWKQLFPCPLSFRRIKVLEILRKKWFLIFFIDAPIVCSDQSYPTFISWFAGCQGLYSTIYRRKQGPVLNTLTVSCLRSSSGELGWFVGIKI